MRFDLNSPSLAQYHWGTLISHFSPAAPVKKDTFPQIIAAFTTDTAPWTTDDELRATAAFLHEIVHLAQDLTTGLGHSDYLTNSTQTNNLLHYASVIIKMFGGDVRPPYREEGAPWLENKEDPVVAEAQGQLRYYPFALMPRERLERIRDILQHDLERPINDEFLFDFSTQSILESDAALTVIRNLRQLQVTTEAQSEIINRNTSLFDRHLLGPEYWRAITHLEAVLSHHAELDERQLSLVIPLTFDLFLDSALACPPLEWIYAREESLDEYEPGVKYARLLIAFQELSGTTMDQFWHALSTNRSTEAEAILLTHTSFRYPSSEEVYKAWIKTLEPRVPKSFTAEVRYEACRWRLSNGVLVGARDINLLVSMEAPIFYLHENQGFVKHDWGIRAFDREKDMGLTTEFVDRFMMMELAEFFFRTGEFRCPHAKADTCSVVEDGCAAGFVHVAQFPKSSSCFARALLARYGVNLPPSNLKSLKRGQT